MQGKAFVLIAAAALVVGACTDSGGDEGQLDVVATTTILGDVVRQVVGDEASVTVLLPIGADPHDYQASARQAAAIQEADLVVANGLDLEAGLSDVLEAARNDGANVLEIAPALDPLPFAGDHADEVADDDEHDDDPHVWMDPIRMADAARLVAAELESLAPGGGWLDRAETYAAQLTAADAEIAAILGAVANDRRKLVTNHDSLGYFAARYGFEVVGVVIPGGATLAEPSSARLAALVETIRRENVPAVFAETTEPAALAEAVAAEAGTDIAVVNLFTGSLGPPDSPEDTLIGMLLTDARRIAEALS